MMQFRRLLLITSIFFAVFTLLITCSYGQATQWASKVVSYSSAFDQGIFFKEGLSYQHYPAQQAVGKPDVLPGNSGDNPNAWVPGKSDQDAFITLGFRYPMQVQQIAIAESYHPGAVYKIFCYDEASQEHLVATLEPKPADVSSRLLNVFIDPTDYKVTAVKLVLQCGAVPGYNAIDALAISSSPVPVHAPIHIAENLNTSLALQPIDASADHEYINLKPVITPDGKTLFFSRKSPRNVGGRRDIEDIWYMEKDEATGKWSQPKNAGQPLNNKGHNFVSAVAPDDSTRYVLLLGNAYKKNNKMRGGVSMSKSTEKGWTQPVAMDIMDFYNYAPTAHYFLSNDRQYLLMAIERADAKGETDLYISFNRGQDNWTTPLNLGNVNTPHMESSPFMASDNTTLYFSSKGYSGFGGQDVYVTHRLDDTWQKWSEPENLGPVINSAKDDTYFNISINNDYAYLTREALDSTQLYQMLLPIFDMPEPVYLVKGQVYNVKNNMPVAAASVVFNGTADSLNITSTTQAGSDGQFTLSLKAGQYELYAESQGYTTLNKMKVDLKALDNDGDKIIYRDLYLIDGALADKNSNVNLLRDLKINKEAIVSEKILFDYNSYALRLTAYRHLDEVAEYLKSNQKLSLQIAGHTSPEGSAAYNKKLSLERARSVANYLAHRGVSTKQLSTIGYGEEKPLFDNNIPANREKNRRVAFKILE